MPQKSLLKFNRLDEQERRRNFGLDHLSEDKFQELLKKAAKEMQDNFKEESPERCKIFYNYVFNRTSYR